MSTYNTLWTQLDEEMKRFTKNKLRLLETVAKTVW